MTLNIPEMRWAGILLLAGGLIFWIGAFSPPYKQWMTKDVREYLSIIHGHKPNWYFIHGAFTVGVLLTLFGVQLLTHAMTRAGAGVYSQLAFTGFLFGSLFWIMNIAFRLTVTVWAADKLSTSTILEPSFKTWMDWTNLLFAIYMVLAYLAIGAMGLAAKDLDLLPPWVTSTCIWFGFAGAALYFLRFPVFEPPLMVHTPLILLGLVILLTIK